MFVLTADQRGSRHGPDLVGEALAALQADPTLHVVRDFERTAGDEFQGVLDDAVSVVSAMLHLVRLRAWSVGVGVGPVDDLPPSTRAGRGPAFIAAREAVEAAKRMRHAVAVRGRATGGSPRLPDGAAAAVTDAQTVAHLVAAGLQQRTDAGWEAVDLATRGLSVTDVGERLGVTRQAAGQRLQAAELALETAGRVTLARLLAAADEAVTAA